eukprot:scaffold525525_cov36-Prasinocladus_malaysianus.AAC.1
MAGPHVAGAAALILARQPGLTGLQLKHLILSTAGALGSLEGKVLTGGVLDVAAAITGQPTDPIPGAPYE